MSVDARKLADLAERHGLIVTQSDPIPGRWPTWTATHPQTRLTVTWGPHPRITIVRRDLAKIAGDKTIAATRRAGKRTRNLRAVTERDTRQAQEAHARKISNEHRANYKDPIQRRRNTTVDASDLFARAALWTATAHATSRARLRHVDAHSLAEALERPLFVIPQDNGTERREGTACKVIVNPATKTIITIV